MEFSDLLAKAWRGTKKGMIAFGLVNIIFGFFPAIVILFLINLFVFPGILDGIIDFGGWDNRHSG